MKVEQLNDVNFKNRRVDVSRNVFKAYGTPKKSNSSRGKALAMDGWRYRIPAFYKEIDLSD